MEKETDYTVFIGNATVLVPSISSTSAVVHGVLRDGIPYEVTILLTGPCVQKPWVAPVYVDSG